MSIFSIYVFGMIPICFYFLAKEIYKLNGNVFTIGDAGMCLIVSVLPFFREAVLIFLFDILDIHKVVLFKGEMNAPQTRTTKES